MRGLTRRWVLQPECADSALTGLGLPPVLVRLLEARGLGDPAEAKRFCEPTLNDLHNPGLMAGVDHAAKGIVDALRRNRLIAIYGDYDVDGITASAILYHIIKAIDPNARVRTYVPHRLEEGYGLNCEALTQLRAEGVDLVVSVDCGITAVRSAQTARENGLQLIITDHHNLPDDGADLPDALAVVHPRLPRNDGGVYPFGELCGAGVAFKLGWHLAKTWCNSERVSQQLQQVLLDMLPLVALGTIADVVPLVGENRVLTSFGLRLIKQTRLVGLQALIKESDLEGESIDSERVGFALAPRLNACGRMGHAADAVRMFTDAPPAEATAIAKALCEHNRNRQSVERLILDQAMKLAEDSGMTRDDCRAILLAHESWHPGVVGIVCARLVDRFGRPAVLLNRSADLCKGSARSIEGYSIHDGLATGREHMITFGGHAMAAGLSFHPQHLETITQRLLEHAARHITGDAMTPAITIDCDASVSELDDATVERLQKMAPFGRANRSPTLRIANVTLDQAPKQMGTNGKHLQLQFRQEGPGGRRTMRGVWWNAGERASDLAAGMRIDLAIEPKLNHWNGRTTVEAHLRDVRICEPATVCAGE